MEVFVLKIACYQFPIPVSQVRQQRMNPFSGHSEVHRQALKSDFLIPAPLSSPLNHTAQAQKES